MNIKDRIQTWAADRFKGVQYPRPVRVRSRQEQAARLPFSAVLTLFITGSAAVVIGTIVLIFIFFFVVPALFSAVFS